MEVDIDHLSTFGVFGDQESSSSGSSSSGGGNSGGGGGSGKTRRIRQIETKIEKMIS